MQVKWNKDKCQHAGVCVKSLPDVFKIEGGSFVIDTSRASDDVIREVTNKCPAGAFTVTE